MGLQDIAIYDTNQTVLFDRPFFANASGTLEGYLLDAWFTGNNTYDALFVDAIPNQLVCSWRDQMVCAGRGTMPMDVKSCKPQHS